MLRRPVELLRVVTVTMPAALSSARARFTVQREQPSRPESVAWEGQTVPPRPSPCCARAAYTATARAVWRPAYTLSGTATHRAGVVSAASTEAAVMGGRPP